MYGSHFPKTGQEVLEEAIEVKIACMLYAGETQENICKELKLNNRNIKKLIDSDVCISTLRKLRDAETKLAAAKVTRGTALLIESALKQLKKKVDSGDLKAIIYALDTASGAKREEQQEIKDSNITVVIPTTSGFNPPNPQPFINVTPTKEDASEV